MSSRKAEERNEKIIRGLMKLPPNRRCINCNSLGPQYVCTSFWTFVCITCSGIHREFTHRVKSVSMSKFTSQEVEALQKGGNQRARETFLNDWDPQRHKFPDSSNADKVREFIKNVYVDKKFAGGKTSDKPPRGMQDLKSHEDEMRRASSYHSYSQSPPYDYQYEERRYGKQAFAFTRKTGSDRGLKVSSSFSPGRLSHHVYEDILANEGSPTFQRDTGFSSPSSETSRDILSEDVRQRKVKSDTKPNAELVPHSQWTACASSFGSFNSNSMSFKSVNSENAVDAAASEPEHSVETTEHTILATFLSLPPHSSLSGNSDSFDLFKTPFPSQTVTSSASVPDLFQLPMTSSNLPVDLFQTSSSVSTTNSHQPSQTFPPPSLDLFADMPQQRSVATLNERSSDVVIQKNEGWATFDVPRQHMEPSEGIQNSVPETMPFTAEGSVGNFGQHLFPNTSTQWSAFHDPTAHGPQSSIPDQWHGSLHNIETTLNAGNDQETWNAFANPVGQLPVESIYQQSSEQVAVQNPSLVADQYLVSKAGALSHAGEKKSTNPFDIPYDSALESNNVFLDTSSLQNGLPNAQMPTLIGGVTEPWFPQHSVTPYIPAGSQGALGLLGGPAPGTQITSVPSQGPVAPIGGNPFA